MTEAVIGLSVAYVGLAALLLSLNLSTRFPTWVKLGAILLVTGLYFLTYHSLKEMAGWPAKGALPEQFLLLASSVTEPDPGAGTDGIIHIWVKSLEGDRPASEPRAFALPYLKELHSRLEEADNRRRTGVLQLGRREPRSPLIEDSPRLLLFGKRHDDLRLYDLPDPALPEK